MSNAVLGKWASEPETVARLYGEFSCAEPFPHVIIDDFLAEDMAKAICDSFPRPHLHRAGHPTWFLYNNPIERKFASTDLEHASESIQQYFSTVQTDEFIALVRRITGIPDLENDPHLHGAGLHFHPTGGKLDMHLDYSLHPVTGKERRINLILYVNSEEWDDAWGGHLYLGEASDDGTLKSLAKRVAPRFNRGVLFRTSDVSWHGLPYPIACPTGLGRQSLAIYYVSDPRPFATPRKKAKFVGVPGEEETEGMAALRDIRPSRRLTEEDVKHFTPEWKSTMDRYVAECPTEALAK